MENSQSARPTTHEFESARWIAQQADKDGDIDGVIAALSAAHAVNPDDVEMAQRLTDARKQKEQFDTALREGQRALTDLKRAYEAGRDLEAEQHFVNVRIQFETARAVVPNNPTVSADYDAAMGYKTRMDALQQVSGLQERGDLEPALLLLDRLKSDYSNDQRIATLQVRLGERVAEVKHSRIETRLTEARREWGSGNVAAAARLYQLILDDDPTHSEARARMREFQAQDAKQNRLNQLLSDAEAHKKRSDFIRAVDAYTEALTYFETEFTVDANVRDLIDQARESDIFGRLNDEAVNKEADKLLKTARQQALRSSNRTENLKYAEIARDLFEMQRFKLTIGQIQSGMVLGELKLAYETAKSLLSEEPNNETFQNQFEAALRAYRTAQDGSASKRIDLGKRSLEAGDYDKALTYFKEAVAFDMTSTEVRVLAEDAVRRAESLQPRAEQFRAEYAKAQAAFEQQEWKSTNAILTRLVSDTSNQELGSEYKRAQELQTQVQQAQQDLTRAQILGFLNRATSLLAGARSEQDFDAAQVEFEKALALDPNNAQAKKMLEETPRKKVEFQELQRLLQQSEPHENEPPYELAAEILERAIQIPSTNTEAQTRYILVKRRKEQWARATRLLADVPDLIKREEFDKAIQQTSDVIVSGMMVEQARQLQSEALYQREKAEGLRAQREGRFEIAFDKFLKAQTLQPNEEINALVEQAQTQAQAQKQKDQERQIQREQVHLLLMRAKGSAEAGDYEPAIEHLQLAQPLAEEIQDAEQLTEVITLLDQVKRQDEERRKFQSLMKEARTAERSGSWQRVLDTTQEAQRLEPENQEAKTLNERADQQLKHLALVSEAVNRADAALHDRNLDEANKQIQELARLEPKHPQLTPLRNKLRDLDLEAKNALLDIETARVQVDLDSREGLEQAVQTLPRLLETMPLGADRDGAVKLYADAQKALARIISREELKRAARELAAKNQLTEALAKIRQATVIDPGDIEAAQLRQDIESALQVQGEKEANSRAAKIAEADGNYEEVIRRAQLVLIADSQNVEMQALLQSAQKTAEKHKEMKDRVERGENFANAGRYEEALGEWQAVLDDPTYSREKYPALEKQINEAKLTLGNNLLTTATQELRKPDRNADLAMRNLELAAALLPADQRDEINSQKLLAQYWRYIARARIELNAINPDYLAALSALDSASRLEGRSGLESEARELQRRAQFLHLVKMGRLAQSELRFSDAIDYFTQALVLDSNAVELNTQIVDLRERAEREIQKQALYEKAKSAGENLVLLENFEGALEKFQEAQSIKNTTEIAELISKTRAKLQEQKEETARQVSQKLQDAEVAIDGLHLVDAKMHIDFVQGKLSKVPPADFDALNSKCTAISRQREFYFVKQQSIHTASIYLVQGSINEKAKMRTELVEIQIELSDGSKAAKRLIKEAKKALAMEDLDIGDPQRLKRSLLFFEYENDPESQAIANRINHELTVMQERKWLRIQLVVWLTLSVVFGIAVSVIVLYAVFEALVQRSVSETILTLLITSLPSVFIVLFYQQYEKKSKELQDLNHGEFQQQGKESPSSENLK